MKRNSDSSADTNVWKILAGQLALGTPDPHIRPWVRKLVQVVWLAFMAGSSHTALGGSRELELPKLGTLTAAAAAVASGSAA
jgi:hypothetical protein